MRQVVVAGAVVAIPAEPVLDALGVGRAAVGARRVERAAERLGVRGLEEAHGAALARVVGLAVRQVVVAGAVVARLAELGLDAFDGALAAVGRARRVERAAEGLGVHGLEEAHAARLAGIAEVAVFNSECERGSSERVALDERSCAHACAEHGGQHRTLAKSGRLFGLLEQGDCAVPGLGLVVDESCHVD